MAFVMQTCFGQFYQPKAEVVCDYFSTRIMLTSRLGGQILGYFDAIRHPIDVSGFVNNLQRKAQEVLPHDAKLPRTLMQLWYEGKLISELVFDTPKIDDQTVDVDVVETYALDYMPLSFAQNLTCSHLLAAKRPVVELLWDEKTFELACIDMDHFDSTFTLNNNTLTYGTTVRFYYGYATWPRLFEKDALCFEVVLESYCMVSPWVHPGRTLRFPVMRFRGGHYFDHGWAENMPKSLVELDVCGGSTTYASDANFRTSLNIQRLRLSKLHLSFVWSSIFKLLNLTALDLSDNDLCIIPSELGRLTELEHLNLSNNPKLSGSLHLATCTKLKELNVLGCAFGLDDFRLGDLLVLIIR